VLARSRSGCRSGRGAGVGHPSGRDGDSRELRARGAYGGAWSEGEAPAGIIWTAPPALEPLGSLSAPGVSRPGKVSETVATVREHRAAGEGGEVRSYTDTQVPYQL